MKNKEKELSFQFHGGHTLAMQMVELGLKKALETDEITWLDLDFDSYEEPKTGSRTRALEGTFKGIFWPHLPKDRHTFCTYSAQIVVRLERERLGFRSAWIARTVSTTIKRTELHDLSTTEKIFQCKPLAEGPPGDDELPARTSYFTEFDD